MLSIHKSTQLVNEMVQKYLFSKGCTLAGEKNCRRLQKYHNYINVNNFKQIIFDANYLYEATVCFPTEIFSQDLNKTVFKVGNYVVCPTKKFASVNNGSQFTRRQVQFALNCLHKRRTTNRIFAGYTIRFSLGSRNMKVGCTWVTEEELQKIYEAMV